MSDLTFEGKKVDEMTREELIQALELSVALYNQVLTKNTRALQFLREVKA